MGGKLVQHDAAKLAQGYSKTVRAVEVLSIVSFYGLMVAVAWRGFPYAVKAPWLAMAGLFFGYLLADFTSGFVHWLADTWGHPDMPVIGKALLRPFREHHVAPKAMTEHDFIETNGNNCLISVPWALGALLMPLDVEGWRGLLFFTMTSIASMIFWVMMTNQFHKWSHFEPHELPALVRWLQRHGLILSPQHHDIHHRAPFDTHYCITTGWLNVPLMRLGFFRGMERLVTALTGAIPRKDDIGLAAALEVAPLPEQPPRVATHTPQH